MLLPPSLAVRPRMSVLQTTPSMLLNWDTRTDLLMLNSCWRMQVLEGILLILFVRWHPTDAGQLWQLRVVDGVVADVPAVFRMEAGPG